MDQDAKNLVAVARSLLRHGVPRDDVYHEVVRFAVINHLDRYTLWQAVQSDA
jgi:hypothetical protein